MKLLWAIPVLSSFAIFAAQAPALADDEFADLAAKAKAEGEVTWYTAHFDTALVGKIGSAFTAKYPGIKVNGLKATAQVSYQRLLQDLSAGAPQAKIFSSTDASQFVKLARTTRWKPTVRKTKRRSLRPSRTLTPPVCITSRQ